MLLHIQVLNASFRRVSRMLVLGEVKPLPASVYDFADIHTALRQFSAAKHVGKIVVRGPRQGVGSLQMGSNKDSRGAWIVTGGLGALGCLTAEWLAGQGWRNIHLWGRTGR